MSHGNPIAKAALDVHYGDQIASVACVVFADWPDAEPLELVRELAPIPSDYRPGRFFERELPCLLSVLERAGRRFETILVDGYVHLRAGKGLGLHLFEALGGSSAVIGVAKNPFRLADHVTEIHRGRSERPLLISAAGMPPADAANAVRAMHGPFRIPTLLKLADRHAREGL